MERDGARRPSIQGPIACPVVAPRRAASPRAKPVTLVNMTCANGDMMPRTKNVTDVCRTALEVADREVLDVLGEGEAGADERAVDDAVDRAVDGPPCGA